MAIVKCKLVIFSNTTMQITSNLPIPLLCYTPKKFSDRSKRQYLKMFLSVLVIMSERQRQQIEAMTLMAI